jgi:hypothetical protein
VHFLTGLAYNTESVANFSRVSLLKWPRFLGLSRTAPDLEAEVMSSFAPPSVSIGALQGHRTHTSLERDTVAEDPAFNSRFGDVVEVSETERNEPQEDDKEEDLEGEEATVLEPVPRELEVLGVAITRQARPQRRRRRKQHRRVDRRHNYQLSTTMERARWCIVTKPRWNRLRKCFSGQFGGEKRCWDRTILIHWRWSTT